MYANVRKAEHPVRSRDEHVDLGVPVLDLGDDRADRFVDERDPDLFEIRHSSPKYGLGLPPPPRNVGRGHEHEQREETPQCGLGHRRRKLDASLDARDRGHADDESRLPAQVAVLPLAPDADAGGRQDRRERGRLGVQLAPPQHEERRHEEDPTADAEEAREQTGAEPEDERQRERDHVASSNTPTTTRKAANARASPRVFRRCSTEGADEDAGGRREPDEQRIAPLDVAVERVANRPGERRDADRAERRRHRRPLRKVGEEQEQRHDDQPAADAEERREEARDDADQCEAKHRSYRMGMDVLARLREAPELAAVLLDVDGTLAPIVDRPEEAAVPEATRDVLRELAERYALVAAVTGREGFVGRAIVGVDGMRVVGGHGLELAEDADEWRARLQDFGRTVDWPVEDKGLGLSYHFRTHPDPARARVDLERVAERAREAGLRARFGRMVLELLPPLDANKGTAVRALLRGPGSRGRCSPATTRPTSTRSAPSRSSPSASRSRSTPPRRRRSCARAPTSSSKGTAGLVDLLRTL